MHDVFICYATKDSLKVNKIVEELEASGLKCWIAPRDIRAGRNFQSEITEAIKSAKAMLIFVSRSLNKSTECINEITVAKHFENSYKLIPVRLQDVKPEGGYLYYLALPQWVEHHASPGETVDAVFEAMGVKRSTMGEPIRESSPVPTSPSQDSQLGALIESQPETGAHRAYAWSPFYLLFEWEGRINRRMFFFAFIIQMLFLLPSSFGVGISAPLVEMSNNVYVTSAWIAIFFLLYFIAIYSGMAMMYKRVHDLGLSGKFIVIPYYVFQAILSIAVLTFVTIDGGTSTASVVAVYMPLIISALVFLLMVLLPGQVGENKFGSKPTFAAGWEPIDQEARDADVASAVPQYEIGALLFKSRGRVSRLPYFMGVLFLTWMTCAMVYIEGIVGGWDRFYESARFQNIGDFVAHPHTWALASILSLGVAYVVISVFVSAKRLQDFGLSPWWSALMLVLIASVLFGVTADNPEFNIAPRLIFVLGPLLVFTPLLLIPGNPQFNRYGPPPGFRAGILARGP